MKRMEAAAILSLEDLLRVDLLATFSHRDPPIVGKCVSFFV